MVKLVYNFANRLGRHIDLSRSSAILAAAALTPAPSPPLPPLAAAWYLISQSEWILLIRLRRSGD